MNDNGTDLIGFHVLKRIDLPVQRARCTRPDGIGIAQIGSEVVIAINHQNEVHYVSLAGKNIDAVAHLMADAMGAATRAAPPTEVTCQ
ncbi:hypothetical protein [Novosphingobium sp. KACC 22771]|uniref:hypothetical protein n=1 Tax=Novosphingobium sp. KACC 22771 TaxID=3025670 RepID=UPI002366393C|nr:hypothetical protein [Novosphingobium sp. KACC 22771]WDF73503.1 hypothetical protein PQ467_05510 [Novosphingobium sp. KACC 22771]